MKKAYLISTGTELLLGSTIDTNSVFLSKRLEEIGIRLIGKSVVGDNEANLKKAFNLALESADIVITSGGLGPTKDDLTKEIACYAMNVEMVLNEEIATKLRNFFESRNRDMPLSNLKQAMFPKEAIILNNRLGTAPGMYLHKDNKVIILLPGPPKEMKSMFIEEAQPYLKNDLNIVPKKSATKVIKVLGPGESQVEEMISEIMDNTNGCSIALIAHEGEVHIRVTAEGETLDNSLKILDNLINRITDKLSDYIFGFNDDTLPSIVLKLLNDKGYMVAFAESCTGGLLSKLITDLSGSSEIFWGTVVSYSNEAKVTLLGVNEITLSKHGAVSEEVAREMVQGVLNVSKADIAVAVTGIAGPQGGTPDKPVGLVYIAVADKYECYVKKIRFVGDRDAVRFLTAKTALDLIRKKLNKRNR